MLLNQNQLAREIQWLSRIEVTVDNLPATRHDRDQFLSVSLLRIGLECDLRGNAFNESVYRRVLHCQKTIDLKLYALDHKTLKGELLSHLGDAEPQRSWQCFKRTVSPQLHYKWMLTVVEKLYSSPAATLQWLVFDERLQTNTNEDISAEIRKYVEFEADLAERVYPMDLLAELAHIIGYWFRKSCIAICVPRPKFGPGATASTGRVSKVEKALRFDPDPETTRLFCQWFYRDEDELSLPALHNTTRQNKIIFVPKNALKHRIISAEPVWLGWYQQMLKAYLYEYVETSPEMFTWFSDQSKSREYALLGSIDARYATIDFSSASDSVTVPIVAAIFEETEFKELLLDTRSTTAVMPDDAIVPLTKFAPMGSATCFAVMDIMFLSICELAVRRSKGRPGRDGDYVVYGDDVTIRADCLEQFLEICSALYLEINREKSYSTQTGMLYRESCGIECLNGRDITPLRYSRFQEPLVVATAPVRRDWWESTVDLMNRCYSHGLWQTRSVIVELIKLAVTRGKDKRKRVLSRNIWECTMRIDASDYAQGYDGPMAIVVPDCTATNYRTQTRYNTKLQRSEVKVLVPFAKPRNHHKVGPEAEQAALNLWYFAALNRPSLPWDASIDITGCAGTEPDKWVWRWCGL